MSYWNVGDKLQLGQSDIEITCEGNNSFTEDQVIGIFIPPTVKFFSGKDCRLRFDLDIVDDVSGTNDATKLMLDGLIGANSLFSQVRTYAGNRQTLLEETRDYNTLVSVKYSYDKNDSLQNKRALCEGAGDWTSQNRGTLGTSKSIQNNVVFNPYMKTGTLGVASTEDIDTAQPFTTAKIELQIHMGVFANNTKAFPCFLTQGVYLELTCEKNARIFRTLDSVAKHRRLCLNPVFKKVSATVGTWLQDEPKQVFMTTADNSQNEVYNSPFQVGEHIGCVNITNNVSVGFAGGDGKCIISKIEVGDATGRIKYTLTGDREPDVDITDGNFVWYSKSTTTDSKPKYTLTNVRLAIRQLDMTPSYINGMVNKMKSNGTIIYDIPSFSTQLYSALKSDVQATIPIDCSHHKARSIICVPTDSKNYSVYANMVGYVSGTASNNTYIITNEDPSPSGVNAGCKVRYSDRSGISGIGDYLTNFSFMIDGKQVPNREVPCSLSSGKGSGLDAQHLLEVEKCLKSAGIKPTSFSEYRDNFIVGRALTLDENRVYNGVGKEIRLNLKYEGTTPDKDKLWKIFIAHTKTLMIKGDDITVVQ